MSVTGVVERAGPLADGAQHGTSERMAQQLGPQRNGVAGRHGAGLVGAAAERKGQGLEVVGCLEYVVDARDWQGVVDGAACLLEGLAGLADDGVRIDGYAEDLGGEVAQVGGGRALAAKRRRGRDRRGGAERAAGLTHAQGGADATEQHGDVSALGTVVGVELVEHRVAEGVGTVGGPQVVVLAAQQQEVEHLVVGQQDVGGASAQGVAVVDQVVGAHRGVAAVLADVETGRDAEKARVAGDELGHPGGLVGSERVHRVEDQGLDALAADVELAGAVVEDRVQEALGLARTSARCDDRRLWFAPTEGREALVGRRLVLVGRPPLGQPPERRPPVARHRAEWCAHP